MLSQEIERLNSVLEGKNGEIRNMKAMFDQEINTAQESLRLSANQNARMTK